ncbi:MAG: hypothetical protein KGQ66_08290, partial [Acidobacteriota bacterium]|nr:hypothetical protein [Acidobacteriota bacterium]
MKLIRPRARTARLLAALSSIAALAPLTLASGTAAHATTPPTYLFVNENPKGPNEVRSYSVNSAGTTTLVGTYSTGHPGSTSSYVASERADTARTAGHLYALNLGDQTLSIFSIDAATGALTLQTTTSPIGATAIAVNPAGTVLYAAGSANEGSLDQLSAYLIASDGTIGASPVSSVAASVDGIAVSPDGTEVATANPGGNQFTTGVELWSADSKGNLAATSTVTAACPTDVRFSPDSTVLYATACASGQLTAYSITAGTLSATAASQVSSQSLAVAPDGTVFVSTASGLTGEVDAAGSFTADPATSYPALSTVTSMTVSPDGTRLFVASFATGSVSDYSIGTGGTLSLLEQIPVLPGLPTVVAYNPVQVPQTITFGSVPSSEPYGTPLTVTATGGGSGHPVTFSAAGGSSCVVSDNGNGTASVTTTGVGTCTILAGQAGGPGYLDGAATASVQVTPAPLTVTASPASQVYGSANPPLTATLSGFVNGDTAASATSGAAACTTTAVATSPVGNYPVNCSIGTLAAINYTFSTFVPAILTVTPAPLSVSADPQSRSYGAANPALTVSFSGFANTDTATTAVTGSPDCTTPATASSPVGAYPITCSVGTLAAANYSIAAVGPSSLTVSPGGLTVTANSQAMVYGSPVPALTATVTGFVNGDTAASAVTGAPVCTTAATSTSPTGTYPITCTTGTLGATNYTFGMFVAGTLTVTPAVLTVTANAQTQVYGGATPPLSTILSGFVAGDGPAVVSGSPSCSTTAIASSPVGPYPITCATGTLSATNYTFASVPGTLTVLPAPLTLVAGDRTASYGAPVVNLGAALTGFVNGDPPSVVTGTPLCSTAAMPTSSVGAYPITCTVGSLNAQNYAITASTAGTYTVTPAALTVTPDAQSMVYGSPAPPLTYTISGFVNGESQASATTGSALCQATVSPTSPVGSYPITCSAGTLQAANYDFTTFDQSSLSVTPAPLTVTAVSVAATYGAALPAPSWTITGFLNGDTAPSATTGSPSCSSSAGTTSGVAQYPITCTQGTLQASNNYTLGSFVPGVLTIGPATLTVAADSQARMYGQPNPGLTATVTGFVNGDPPSVVSGSPSCTTDAVASSPVGSYQITCVTTGMSAANYVFGAPLSGTLTVTQGGLTITAKSYDTTYGSPVAAPTATISGFVNGDTTATATTGTPACTTTATAASPVGTYPITCTIGTL